MKTIRTRILSTTCQAAAGKWADAEIQFDHCELDGLKLVRFAAWSSCQGQGENVNHPSRLFIVHGERGSFSLLGWVSTRAAQQRLEAAVLKAYRGVQQDDSEHVARRCAGEAL